MTSSRCATPSTPGWSETPPPRRLRRRGRTGPSPAGDPSRPAATTLPAREPARGPDHVPAEEAPRRGRHRVRRPRRPGHPRPRRLARVPGHPRPPRRPGHRGRRRHHPRRRRRPRGPDRVRLRATRPSEATLSVDGDEVEEPGRPRPDHGVAPARAALAEGDHARGLGAPGRASATPIRWGFTVDGTARPRGCRRPSTRSTWATPPRCRDGRGGRRADRRRRPVEVDDDGALHPAVRPAAAGPVNLDAVDRAGNPTTAQVVVPDHLPGLRGVHVSAAAWSNAGAAGRRSWP